MMVSRLIGRAGIITTLALGLALSGCEEAADGTAPPPPALDPVVSPTSLPTQILTGTAEPGSTVDVTGGVEAVFTTANPFTAEFRVEVALAPDAATELVLTATDGAGNTSEPVAVTIVRESPRPESVLLAGAVATVDADDGALTVTATIGNDEAAVGLAGFELQFAVVGPDDVAPKTATSDAQGRATVTFEELRTAGAGTVTVTAKDAPLVVAQTSFAVVAGAAATLDLGLAVGQGVAADPLLGVVAGQEIRASVTVEDAWGNAVGAAPILASDAPDALVSGLDVSHVTTAGTWTVTATQLGTDVSDAATFEVVPANPAAIIVTLDPPGPVMAGADVQVTTSVVDTHGNAIEIAEGGIDLTVTPAPAAPATPVSADGKLHIESPAGTYVVHAALVDDAAVTGTQALDVQPAALDDFRVLLADAGADPAAPGATELQIVAGADVVVTVIADDAHGNPVHVPYALNTDVPADLLDGVLVSVRKAGDYKVKAQVLGTQETAMATLHVVPATVTKVTLELSDETTHAGASVLATATAFDAFGNVVEDAAFTYSVLEAVTAPAKPVTGNKITIEAPAAPYTVRATLVGGDDVHADAPLLVLPAGLSEFLVRIDDVDDPEDAPKTKLTVEAATSVQVTVTLRDLFGNALALPYTLTTDAPGELADGVLEPIEEAGTYTILASLDDEEASSKATLVVIPGSPASASVTVEPAILAAGETAVATGAAYDVYGNAIPESVFAFAVEEAVSDPLDPVVDDAITIAAPSGAYTVTASLVVAEGDPEITASTPLEVVPAAVAAFELFVDDADAPGDVPSSLAEFGPDASIAVTWLLEDAFGNEVDLPVTLETDAPGVLADALLSGVTTVGTYSITGTITGTEQTAVATVMVAPGAPDSASIELDPSEIVAGGSTSFVTTAFDAFGNVVPGTDFEVTVVQEVTEPANPVTAGEVTIAAPAGAFLVHAAVVGAPEVAADAPLEVVPAALVELRVELDRDDATGDLPVDSLQVPPDTPVNVTVTATDTYGNPSDEPIEVTTDAPGLLAGGQLTGVTKPGHYAVTATVAGTETAVSAQLEVVHGPQDAVALELSAETTVAGVPVTASATLLDAWDNAFEGETFTFTIDEPVAKPAAPVSGGQITIRSDAGAYTVRATLDSDPSFQATAPLTIVAAQPASVTIELQNLETGAEPEAVLDVPPDTEVRLDVVIADEYGNPIDRPYTAATNAPGLIVNEFLTGVTEAGTYLVVATMADSTLSGTATLVVHPDAPASIVAALDRQQMAAGGKATVSAAVYDVFGNEVPDEPVAVSVVEPVTLPAVPVTGSAVTIAAPAGIYTVVATVVGTPGLTAELPLLVAPGPIATFVVELDDADLPDDVPTSDLTVPAGTGIGISFRTEDAFGNDIGAPVTLTTTAPGIIIGGQLLGVTAAGAYDVVATATGSTTAASAKLTVVPGEAAHAELTLDVHTMAAGGTATAAAVASDAFGNVIPSAAFAYSVLEAVTAPASPVEGAQVTIASPTGKYTIAAEVVGAGGVTATAPLVVAPAALELFEVLVADAGDAGAQPAATATVTVGHDVALTVRQLDAFGNATELPLAITTDAPGLIVDGSLAGVTKSGTYEVVATVSGTLRSASAEVTYEPGQIGSIVAQLDHAQVMAGQSVHVTAAAHDIYGNAFPSGAFAVSVVEAVLLPAEPVSGMDVTIQAPAATYTVHVQLASDGSLAQDLPLVVVPAALDELSIALDDASIPDDVPGPALEVAPATDVAISVEAHDVYGNALLDKVFVTTTAPGTLVDDQLLVDVTTAGTYEVRATLASAGVSQKAQLVVVPGPATGAALVLDSETATAGAEVGFEVAAVDAWGNPVGDEAFDVTIVEPVTAPATPVADDMLVIESPTGSYTVTAVSTVNAALAAEATLEIVAGPPAPAGFELAITTTDINLGTAPVDVAAGTPLEFAYAVKDEFGNVVPSGRVDVLVNAPGALVLNDNVQGGSVLGLNVPGSFTVLATIRDTDITKIVPFTVKPGAATRLALVVGTNYVPQGEAVPVFFTVTDAYGNLLPDGTIEITVADDTATYTGDPSAALDGDEISFGTPGTWSVSAEHVASGATDVKYVTVTQLVDFQPPTVSILAPSDGDEFSPGALVKVSVAATDTGGLHRVGIATAGVLVTETQAILPPGVSDTVKSFTLAIPAGKYGPISIVAYAEDLAGNLASSNEANIVSRLPHSITCPSCEAIELVAAGFSEGNVFPSGDEGGIRSPREIAVSDTGEVYVALFENIRLGKASAQFGTEQIETYISVVEPDGEVLPFAVHVAEFDINDQAVIGLDLDPVSGLIFAALGDNRTGNGMARLVAFDPTGGVVDPFFDLTPVVGWRDHGLGYIDGRLFAAYKTDKTGAYAVDPGPVGSYLYEPDGGVDVFDVCGGDGDLYFTRTGGVDTCMVTVGAPTTCGARTALATGALVAGNLGSCAVSPSGRVVVANRSSSSVVSIDPTGVEPTEVLVQTMPGAVGVAFDPTTDDLLVSSETKNAVFRFVGEF